MDMTALVVAVVSAIVGIVSMIFHAVVVHRLSCTKDFVDCLKTCVPDIAKKTIKESSLVALEVRLKAVENTVDDLADAIDDLLSLIRGK